MSSSLFFVSGYLYTSAGFFDGIWDGIKSVFEGLVETIWNGIMALIFGKDMWIGAIDSWEKLYQEATTAGVRQCTEYLDVTGNTKMYAGLNEMSQNVSEALAVIGVGLVILWAFLSLASQMSQDRISGNSLIRLGLSLVVGLVLVTNSHKVMLGVESIGVGLTDFVSDTVKKPTTTVDGQTANAGVSNDVLQNWWYTDKSGVHDKQSFQKWGEKNFFGAVMTVFRTNLVIVIVWLINKVLGIYAISVALSRGIQIFVYAAISPIAMSELFHHGFGDSSGMRFIKKFFGLCAQAAVLVLIMNIAATFTAASDDIIMIIAISLCQFSMIGKSQQITSDIFGV